MKKRVFNITMALIVALSSLLGFSACGRDATSNDPDMLEVYIWDAGYGKQWLDEMLKDFGTLDYVKEKYPNYDYDLKSNDQNSYGESRIAQGKNNTIDLFFTEAVESYFGTSSLLDLTECVYNQTVLGENVLIKDKMQKDRLKRVEYIKPNEEIAYYYVPWTCPIGGLIYNKTLFSELGLSVPRTTDELFALMDTVKGWEGRNQTYPYTYSISASQINYIGYTWTQWWAQYEGVEAYSDFYKGISIDKTINSSDILYEKGRLEAFKIMERMHSEDNGYYNRSSSTLTFIQGQTQFLLRKCLIQPCGDWFSNEMKDLAVEYKNMGYDDEVGMLKTPVISSIIENLTTINDDATLCDVIDEIDQGKTSSSVSGVSQVDFDRVREARGIIGCGDTESLTVIPSDATAKELAIDFLRYIASDRANEIYAVNTMGGRLPFNYNFETQSPTKYNELMTNYRTTFSLQSDCSKIVNASNAIWLPLVKSNPLVAYGNFNIFPYGDDILICCLQGTKTAQQLYDECITYYTENNLARWNKALSNAGLL